MGDVRAVALAQLVAGPGAGPMVFYGPCAPGWWITLQIAEVGPIIACTPRVWPVR